MSGVQAFNNLKSNFDNTCPTTRTNWFGLLVVIKMLFFDRSMYLNFNIVLHNFLWSYGFLLQ